jgi:hypothetical protein
MANQSVSDLICGVCLVRGCIWSSRVQHSFSDLSRDSSVGIATDYGLDDRMIGVRFPVGAGNLSLRHRVQTGSGTHPASYPVGTGCSFPSGKAAESCN